jgi:hypothetical protein
MTAVGARSVTVVALLAGTVAMLWWQGILRADYWGQLDPWVPFLAGGFAVLCGTLVFAFWRLVDRSEYYFRIGERLPWAFEIALVGSQHRTLIVGHAAHAQVIDVPPAVQRAMYVAIFFGMGLVAVTNRAVALLRDVPRVFAPAEREFCTEPAPPEPATTPVGCKLVIRAYQLGYATSLGSCAPRTSERKIEDVCRKRQRDEPYLHYAWRLFDGRIASVAAQASGTDVIDRFEAQLDHTQALLDSTLDSVAMAPRSSHHLFTNLPDPEPALADRVHTALERGCGARLAHLQHFPRTEDTPIGRSKLLQQVLDQLLFHPGYKPVVAQCGETIVHWGAPVDACARLVAAPRSFLDSQGALEPVAQLIAWRRRKAELARLHMRELGEPAPADRIVSFQCLMFGDADQPPGDHAVAIDGETLHVRDTRMAPLDADGASQIRLYKRLAALLAEGFSYGHLSSNESIGGRPDDAAMAAAFADRGFLLTRLDLLRDADLFVGNAWLTERSDLLEVYPYHLHLENFIAIFRRQYGLHRGRL